MNSKILLILLLLISLAAKGQNPSENTTDRLTAARVAYITNRLNLNTNQAQQFWPLFNEFEAARKKVRKQIRQLKVESHVLDGTDEEIKNDLKKLLALRQEELDLEKTYVERFLKVLSPKQLAEYYRAEKEFTRMLVKRVKDRRGQRDEKEKDDY